MTSLTQIAALYVKTEPQRYEAEVRFVAALPSRAHRIEYLLGEGGIAERRGREAARRIVDALAAIGVDSV